MTFSSLSLSHFLILYLEIRQKREIQLGHDVQGGSHGQQQLELVVRVLPVTVPAKAPDFEKTLQVEQHGEADFDVVVALVEHVPGAAVVFEAHGGGDHAVGQDDAHDKQAEPGRPEHRLTAVGCQSVVPTFAHLHQTPTTIVPGQNLKEIIYDIFKRTKIHV